MAQIHALLMTAINPPSTDEVMEQLLISRGNAHTNLKKLERGKRKDDILSAFGFGDVLEMITLDLVLQGAAADPETFRGLFPV